MKIYESITYVDDYNRQIFERCVVVSTDCDVGVSFYSGVGTLTISQRGQPVTQAQFAFEIPGDDIAQAFGNYDMAFKKGQHAAEMDIRSKIEAERTRIITPNG